MSFHYSDDTAVANLVNNSKFRGLDEIGDNLIEVENMKPFVKLDVPIQLGFFVLEYAKLLLLRFYYDFLIKFLEFDTFSLIQCDTDSLYISLSENTLFATVRKAMRNQFIEEYDQWIARQYCDKHKRKFFNAAFSLSEWKPKDCCKSASKYFLRQPGLFHLENVSKGVVALSSKCYYCFGGNTKYSSKGISKTHNQLTDIDYKHVLFNKTILHATNRGMRIRGKRMFTYTQRKKGLNYMYGKRIVCSDSITTMPTKL